MHGAEVFGQPSIGADAFKGLAHVLDVSFESTGEHPFRITASGVLIFENISGRGVYGDTLINSALGCVDQDKTALEVHMLP
ncbi:hypothetical protein ADUPG1_004379, partial [Aduncisulcus paluster]